MKAAYNHDIIHVVTYNNFLLEDLCTYNAKLLCKGLAHCFFLEDIHTCNVMYWKLYVKVVNSRQGSIVSSLRTSLLMYWKLCVKILN